jgi:peptide/nickel transport system ATP-binding protein
VSSPLLEVKNLTISYKIKSKIVDVVKDVNFKLNKGDRLAIVGESGSGKTTLALAILGLLPKNAVVKSGEILFNGINLLKLTSNQWRDIRWRKIAMIFQASMNGLDPVMKIGDQLIELYIYHNKYSSKEDVKEKIVEIIKKVNLSPTVLNLYPHELSGGMKQRIIIASSLLLNPDLLIADEPTTALDVITQSEILSLIKRISEERNITLMFITHDISLASLLCKKVLIMYGGTNMEEGELREVISNPLHPYTKHLISSLLEIENGTLTQSKKDLSTYISFSGCPFNLRCPYSDDICKISYPKPIMVNDNSRIVRCFLYKR